MNKFDKILAIDKDCI